MSQPDAFSLQNLTSNLLRPMGWSTAGLRPKAAFSPVHCTWLARHKNMKNLRDGICGPESLSAIQQAFNQAGSILGRNHVKATMEPTRPRLATCLLSIADDKTRDVEWLMGEARDAMARGGRTPSTGRTTAAVNRHKAR